MVAGLSQTRREYVHVGLIAASLLLTVCDRPATTGFRTRESAV